MEVTIFGQQINSKFAKDQRMKIQFDIDTKYCTFYNTNFLKAIEVIWHNRKTLQCVRIWIYKSQFAKDQILRTSNHTQNAR